MTDRRRCGLVRARYLVGMHATAAALGARLVSLRAQLVWLACVAAGIAAVGPVDLTHAVAAATVVVGVLLAVGLARALQPPHRHATREAGLRQRALRTGVARQCDPDAAGRPRPRAPSRNP
jgi:hypothetical protein